MADQLRRSAEVRTYASAVLVLALCAAPSTAWLSGCAQSRPVDPPAAAAAAPAAAASVAPAKPAPPAAPPIPQVHEGPDQGARPPPAGLVALREELQRAMQTLGKASPAVHHLAYTVTLHEQVDLSGEHGTLANDSRHEQRTLDVDVRVGNPAFDSHHASRQVPPVRGHTQTLPLDGEDTVALRQSAWLATDGAYKEAAERFVSLKNQKQVKAEDEDQSPDFSTETPARWIGEAAPPLALDLDAWRARLRTLSARFKADPAIHEADLALHAQRRTRWFLSSEGAEVAVSERRYRLTMSARTQADDGMPLHVFKSFEAWTPEGLPGEAQLGAAISELSANLAALRKAPLAEPFAGPAILEGRAAGVFFHEVIGHRLEAHRLRNDFDGQTFGKKLGQQVMPPFLSLYDDPTIRTLGDTEVAGHYFFDDEGVAAQRATLVDAGVLRGFLFGRTPARGLTKSNGHGRRQEGRPLVSRQGNLVLEASETVPVAALRQRLVEEAKKQGRAYGLRFADIQGGFTDTSRFGTQGFKVMPTLVYRVYVDGRPDELIRGVDIVGTPLAMLLRIQAAGDDHDVFNGVCGAESGWVPVSSTAPSLLVGQVETALKDKGNTKPPVLESPSAAPAPVVAAGDAQVRRALEDELARSLEKLKLGTEAPPYYLRYVVNDSDRQRVAARLGALLEEERNPVRLLRVEARVGSPDDDNTNFRDSGGGLFFRGPGLAITSRDDDYAGLRQELWRATDDVYKYVLEQLARKKAQKVVQSVEKEKVADFAAAPAIEKVTDRAVVPTDADRARLRELVVSLSRVFAAFPTVASGRVDGTLDLARRRLLSSEKTWTDERRSRVRIEVRAEAFAPDGQRLAAGINFGAASVATLPPAAELEEGVRELARYLEAQRAAPTVEPGEATVLFERQAAGQLARLLLAGPLSGQPVPRAAGEAVAQDGSSSLADKLGLKVAPAWLEVIDDPAATGPGKSLLAGGYDTDDEGVAAERVVLVDKGVVKSLLMSRTPRKEIGRSNGHGRMGPGGVRASAANLFVTAQGGLLRPALLAAAAKAAGPKGAVYVVRELDPQSGIGRGQTLQARVAFRVKDGKEEPVRGLSLEGFVPKRLKKDLIAAGKEPTVLEDEGFGAPASVVAPALLFEDVDVGRPNDKNRLPPLYPSPLEAGRR